MEMDSYTRPDFTRCALLTIDMQNDFVLPNAPVVTDGAQAMLTALTALVRSWRGAALPIIHIIRLYGPGCPEADICRRERVESGEPLLNPGTDGAKLAQGLLPQGVEMDFDLLASGQPQELPGKEYILYKPRWSAFFDTPLAGMLRGLDVDSVAVAGTWFPNCVRSTLYDAAALNFRAVAVADAIAGIYDRGIGELAKIGITALKTHDLIAELGG